MARLALLAFFGLLGSTTALTLQTVGHQRDVIQHPAPRKYQALADIGIRAGPNTSSSKLRGSIASGTVFDVVEERDGHDGQTYLKLSSEGWAFTKGIAGNWAGKQIAKLERPFRGGVPCTDYDYTKEFEYTYASVCTNGIILMKWAHPNWTTTTDQDWQCYLNILGSNVCDWPCTVGYEDTFCKQQSYESWYRLQVTASGGGGMWCIQELKFYDQDGGRIAVDSHRAHAESEYSSTFSASNAFNEHNDHDAGSYCSLNYETGWLQYEFEDIVDVAQYSIEGLNDLNGQQYSPTAWMFQRSDDGGITWNTIETRTGETLSNDGTETEFTWNPSTSTSTTTTITTTTITTTTITTTTPTNISCVIKVDDAVHSIFYNHVDITGDVSSPEGLTFWYSPKSFILHFPKPGAYLAIHVEDWQGNMYRNGGFWADCAGAVEVHSLPISTLATNWESICTDDFPGWDHIMGDGTGWSAPTFHADEEDPYWSPGTLGDAERRHCVFRAIPQEEGWYKEERVAETGTRLAALHQLPAASKGEQADSKRRMRGLKRLQTSPWYTEFAEEIQNPQFADSLKARAEAMLFTKASSPEAQ